MEKIFPCTLAQAAARLGCHRSTVARKAKTLKLGTPVGLNVILLDRHEFAKLKASITPGRRGRKKGK